MRILLVIFQLYVHFPHSYTNKLMTKQTFALPLKNLIKTFCLILLQAPAAFGLSSFLLQQVIFFVHLSITYLYSNDMTNSTISLFESKSEFINIKNSRLCSDIASFFIITHAGCYFQRV